MTLRSDDVTELTEDEAWEFLAQQPVGRLATAVAGEPDIWPLNHAVGDRALYVHTTPGSKLAELAVNHAVAYEADRWDDAAVTSVVLKGTAEILEHDADLAEAEGTGLETFTATPKDVWVRVVPREISGRRYAR